MPTPTWTEQYLPAAIIWRGKVSSSSASIAMGDWLCIDPTDTTGKTATKAVAAALTTAGAPLCIATQAALPGASVQGYQGGYVPNAVTGLGAGATQAVRINTTTARSERVASPSGSDYAVGMADSAGGCTLDYELPGLGSANILNPGNPADDNKMLRASGGAWVLTSTVKTDGTSISLGTTPATTGILRVAHGFTERGRNLADSANIDIFSWGVIGNNALLVGSSSVENTVYDVATGFSHIWRVNNVTAASLTSAAFSLPLGGTAAASGSMRVAQGFSLVGRTSVASDAKLLEWGVGTDIFVLGGQSGPFITDFRFNTATGGLYRFFVNSVSEYQFNATHADFTDNELRFGTSPATGAKLNTVHSVNFWNGLSSGGAARNLLRWGTTADTLLIGDSNVAGGVLTNGAATATYVWQYNNATVQTFNSTGIHLASGKVLQFNTTETAGLLNFNHQVLIASGRHSGGAANVDLVRWGGSNNKLVFGQQTNHAGYEFDTATGGLFLFRINGNPFLDVDGTRASIFGGKFVVDADKMTIVASVTPPAGNPSAGTVYLWLENDILKYRTPGGVTKEL